jgi:hypothetical protein
MRIEFHGGAASLRRWHLDLATRLEAAGHMVGLTRSADSAGMAGSAGLSLLVALERRLFAVPPALRSEPVQWPSQLSAPREACDLVIVLDGAAPAAEGGAAALLPLYDGEAGEAAAIEALLDGRAPFLAVAIAKPGDAEARLLATALPALEEPRVFTASLERVCAHMGALILRAVAHLAEARADAAMPALASPAAPRRPTPGLARAGAFAARNLAAKIANRLTRLCAHREHWRIGWRMTAQDEVSARLALPGGSYAFLPDDARRFYADPFVFWRDGTAYVFCEEFPYATGKGVISVFAIGKDGKAGEPRIVLERPYHLSYPMVFERDGAIFMIPETSANRSVELYRALRFPDQWALEATLLQDLSAADATLVERNGRLWLFAALAEEGGSSWDALGLFHAERLAGPWTAHAGNPVLVDASSARPGGMMVERMGRLIRPAQDCTGGYGSALALCSVDRLDPENYAQTVLARLAPRPDWGFHGLHTLNAAGGIEVIDCVGRRARWG